MGYPRGNYRVCLAHFHFGNSATPPFLVFTEFSVNGKSLENFLGSLEVLIFLGPALGSRQRSLFFSEPHRCCGISLKFI